MKTTAVKRDFIRLRAEGKSFSAIAGELHISKTTCTKWGRALASEIDDARRSEMASLAEEYGLARVARIKSLGETLKRIDEAIAKKCLINVDGGKLLAMKLKYLEALKAEGIDQAEAPRLTYDTLSEEALLTAYCGVLDRARSGEEINIQAEARLIEGVRDAFKATQSERFEKSLATQILNRHAYECDGDDEEEDGDGAD